MKNYLDEILSIKKPRGGYLSYYRKSKNFLIPKKRSHQLKSISKNETKRVVLEANKTLRHKFEILSKEISFGKEINWHTNFAGKSWPILSNDELNVNYLSNFDSQNYIGDVKLPWEFSKHLFWQDLAKAYIVTNDERYTQEFLDQIESFLEQNPYGKGVNWTQGLIASHRVISWIISLPAFIHSPKFTEEKFQKIFFSIYEHALFIEKTYEFTARASNHLLGELCASIIISATFPELKGSKKRLEDALKYLDKEINYQILPDGVDYEKSTSYHRVVYEFMLLVLILNKRNSFKLSGKIIKRLEKMAEFLMNISQPSGLMQPISDADGARVFILGNDINDPRPHLALSAWIYNRSDFAFIADGQWDKIIWFLSDQEIEKLKNIKKLPPKQGSFAFNRGGYWILRQNWSKNSPWLFFDCGNMGLGDWPADMITGVHGHSDILNFGLALGEETFLTDNGSYQYTTERPFHQYFRSAVAHNVPIVDDQDQNIIEPLPWLSRQVAKPQGAQHYFNSQFDYLSGEHTGYLRLPGKIISRREILFDKEKSMVIIKDSFLGKGKHRIKELFHLMPNLQLADYENGYLIKGKKQRLVIKPLFQAKESSVIGGQRPVEGWYAPTYGEKEKAFVLSFKKESLLPISLYFFLSWGEAKLSNQQLIDYFEAKAKIVRRKKLLMLVTNDVNRDPRVQKEANSAYKGGFDVEVLAYYLSTVQPDEHITDYKIRRFQHQPLMLKAKIKTWVAKKLMNIYYKNKYLGPLLVVLGKASRRLKKQVANIVSESMTPSNNAQKENLKISTTRKRRSFAQIFSLIYYYRQLNKKLITEAIRLDPQIVHANDLDTLYAGYIIKKKTGAKLVYDAHEIWWEQGLGLPRILIWFFKKLEGYLLKKVDCFISVNESVAKIILKEANLVFPAKIIYNCPQFSKPNQFIQKNKEVIVLYQGLFIPNRGIRNLILAGKFLKKNVKLIFRGYGYQDITQELKDIANKTNLKNITFAPAVAPDKLVAWGRKADIGVILYLPKNLNNKYCSPNKLFEYMMSGLALVVSDLPELRKIVTKYKNGILVNPNNIKAISQAINQLASNPKLLGEMKKNSLQAAKVYNWENQEKKLLAIYNQLS